MKMREIERIINPYSRHFVGDGFLVYNIIPGSQGLTMQRMSPFIMMDYNAPHYFSPVEVPRGVDVHPHRGFETVTIAYKGKVEHHDSSGGGGVIGQGDVQWMTAGSGVLHKEFHEKEWAKQGGEFQMVQLWVNLPAKDKMSAPKYQAILAKEMEEVLLDEVGSKVKVIAGAYEGAKGKASTFTPIHLMNAYLKKDKEAIFTFPNHYTTALLVLEGEVKVNEEEVPTNNFVLFENNGGETFQIKAISEDSLVLILSGEPILEPIAAHGPFVMNTKAELMQAFEDFNNGKFGELD
jgi:redox-sensitive bicupin YhaK (pirin superfamily)